MLVTELCPLMRPYCTNPAVEAPLAFNISGYPEWTGKFLSRPASIKKLWPRVHDNVWLEAKMLAFLSEHQQGIESGALLLQHQNGAKVLVCVQFLIFRAGRQIRGQAVNPEATRFDLRRRLLRFLQFKTLTLGQFLVSGPYGWELKDHSSEMQDHELATLLSKAAVELAGQLKGVHAVLIKDLCPLDDPKAGEWQQQGYYQLPVDASMQMTLPADWKTTKDYLQAISSKYRVRYRRARKQLPEDVYCQELDLSLTVSYREKLDQLYRQIKAEAAFDAVNLELGYFEVLKEQYPQAFRIHGYFQRDELIGFRSSMANGDTLHAHYLGFDQGLNRQYHLYHNMLFDLLEEAIAGRFTQLDYGRTALEIKSSIGAEPVDYFCGIRALNPVLNWLIPRFTPAVFRPQEWTQRQPFK